MSTSTNAEFLHEIYAALVKQDAVTGEYSPYLAESFDVVDNQTLTVTIRADANFHDGRPVTAQDAKASIEATKANTAESTCNCNRGIGLVDSVEVVDDKTFVVHLSGPGLATVYELLIGTRVHDLPGRRRRLAGHQPHRQPGPSGSWTWSRARGSPSRSGTTSSQPTRSCWEAWSSSTCRRAPPQLNALLAGDIDMAMELDLPDLPSHGRQGRFRRRRGQQRHHLHLVRGLPGAGGLLRGHQGAPGLSCTPSTATSSTRPSTAGTA